MTDRVAKILALERRVSDLALRLSDLMALEGEESGLHENLLSLEALSEKLKVIAGSAGPDGMGWTRESRINFGKLFRDKRNAAGFSRRGLAREAKLSDATIKFIETARFPPSRASLIRLVGVAALRLSWAEIPVQIVDPALLTEPPARAAHLDPAAMDVIRLMNHGLLFGARLTQALAVNYGLRDPISIAMDLVSIPQEGEHELTRLILAIYRRVAADVDLQVPLLRVCRDLLPMLGSAELLVVHMGLRLACRKPDRVQFLSELAEKARDVSPKLAFDIYQLSAWVHLSPENALAFAAVNRAARHWVIAALYGYLHADGDVSKSELYAAILSERADLSAGLAAALSRWSYEHKPPAFS